MIPVALYLGYAVAYLVSAGAIAESGGGIVGFSSLILLSAPIYRYMRRSTTEERMSVRWAILAVLVGVGLFVVIIIAEGGTVAEHGPISVAAANFAGIIIPVGLAVGLLRPRIIDVDRALAAVVALIAAAAVIAVTGYTAWWASAALSVDPAVSAAVVGVAVAVVTVPISRWARDFAVWLVFRGRLGEDAAASKASMPR